MNEVSYSRSIFSFAVSFFFKFNFFSIYQYHTTRMYHDNIKYKEAVTKEQVCEAANHGIADPDGTLVMVIHAVGSAGGRR